MHACETGVIENVPVAVVFGDELNWVVSSNRPEDPLLTQVPLSRGCAVNPISLLICWQKVSVTLGSTAINSAASVPVLGRLVCP